MAEVNDVMYTIVEKIRYVDFEERVSLYQDNLSKLFCDAWYIRFINKGKKKDCTPFKRKLIPFFYMC